MAILEKGEVIEPVAKSPFWTKVKLSSGDMGWIHSDFLQEKNPR
jgi:SH3-like domain-containing protein